MKLPIALNPKAVSLSEGLRAGLAVALVVVVGSLFNVPDFGLAALGALLTCFADPGGPVARRSPAVITFALLGGAAYAVFGLVRAHLFVVAAPLAGFAIFCASFARIYGQGGLQVGNLLSVVIVLALDHPAVTLDDAVRGGGIFLTGTLWAAVLTLIIWRLHPFAPSRRALAEVAVAMGQLARDLSRLANREESVAAFTVHASTHRRRVREAIEQARVVAGETFRTRGVISARAAQLVLRLETFEQMFQGLTGLSDLLEQDRSHGAAAARALRLCAGWLLALGPEIVRQAPLDTPKKAASLRRLQAETARLPAEAAVRHVLEAVAERLAILTTAPAGEANEAMAMAPALTSQSIAVRVLGPIRANLNFGSAAMRHALRTGALATAALAVCLPLHQPFAHWLTITLVLTLQPYFSATWLRAAERIGGTVLGGLLAGGIGLLVQSKMALALAMLPLTMFAFTIRSVSYGGFVAAATPMLVLLVEQIAPGSNELTVAVSRVLYTLLGGLLAVLGNALLWPGFESTRLDGAIVTAISAHRMYAQSVLLALSRHEDVPSAARRSAGLASNNLEAALNRAMLEPHRRRDPALQRGALVDAALRRLAGRLSAMAMDRPAIGPEALPLWRDWADWLNAVLAGRIMPRPALPPGPGADALTRLARQAELITGADGSTR